MAALLRRLARTFVIAWGIFWCFMVVVAVLQPPFLDSEQGGTPAPWSNRIAAGLCGAGFAAFLLLPPRRLAREPRASGLFTMVLAIGFVALMVRNQTRLDGEDWAMLGIVLTPLAIQYALVRQARSAAANNASR